MTEYGVTYEQAEDGGWWASAVDLPVFAAGETKDEAERQIRSAIAFHIEGLVEDGEPVPESTTRVGTVTV